MSFQVIWQQIYFSFTRSTVNTFMLVVWVEAEILKNKIVWSKTARKYTEKTFNCNMQANVSGLTSSLWITDDFDHIPCILSVCWPD